MIDPDDDPVGSAISQALQAIGKDSKSQDLTKFYSLIGSKLADSGRQDADDSHVKQIAQECAKAAVEAKPSRDEATELATKEIFSRLHRDGLRASEKQVRDAASSQVGHFLTKLRQNGMRRHIRRPKLKG
jgi:hypothetical protein